MLRPDAQWLTATMINGLQYFYNNVNVDRLWNWRTRNFPGFGRKGKSKRMQTYAKAREETSEGETD